MINIKDIISKTDSTRILSAVSEFNSIFPEHECIEVYSAPGRTEICGNHCDHQRGRVLAASVNLDSIAVVSPRDDMVVRCHSVIENQTGYSQEGNVSGLDVSLNLESLDALEAEKGTVDSLIRGVSSYLKNAGYVIGGFDAYVTSNVPVGSGLSSSAMFECLIGVIIAGLYNGMNIDPITLAKAGVHAENFYYGKPCGMMDQAAIAVGGMVMFDFEDPDNPSIRQLITDTIFSGYDLCIVNTGGSHTDLTDEYAAVPLEMCEVAKHFGKKELRDVHFDEIINSISELREELGDRAVLRALHFKQENERVIDAASALDSGDFRKFLDVIKESGNSSARWLQNIYSSKAVNNQNMTIALCLAEMILDGDGAARVHGGGFAGTIQAWVPYDLTREFIQKMNDVFGPGSAQIINIRANGATKLI